MTTQAFQILISISLISVFLTGYYRPIDPIREWVTTKWINFFISRQMYRTAEVVIASIFALLINKLVTDVIKDK